MKPLVRCPTCRKETSWDGNPWRPFCSERCATVDLGRWADHKFAIPVENPEDLPGAEESPPSSSGEDRDDR
jgi:endogenous inhibitor of DNA gyrase (YacG/DUF329 family)